MTTQKCWRRPDTLLLGAFNIETTAKPNSNEPTNEKKEKKMDHKPALINTLVSAPMTQGINTQSYAGEIEQYEWAEALTLW